MAEVEVAESLLVRQIDERLYLVEGLWQHLIDEFDVQAEVIAHQYPGKTENQVAEKTEK